MSKRIFISCEVILEDDADIVEVAKEIELNIEMADDVIHTVGFHYNDD